VQEPIAVRVCE